MRVDAAAVVQAAVTFGDTLSAASGLQLATEASGSLRCTTKWRQSANAGSHARRQARGMQRRHMLGTAAGSSAGQHGSFSLPSYSAATDVDACEFIQLGHRAVNMAAVRPWHYARVASSA